MLNNYISKIINYKLLSYLFLLSIFIFITYKLYFIDQANHPFILADWLINFEDGGFKRRGISDSFLFFLQDITSLKLQLLVYFIQLTFYVIFFYSFIIISKEKIFPPLLFLYIWSPLVLLFYVNDTSTLGRKEIILFALFGLYIISIIKNKFTLKHDILFALLLSIAVLFHELIIFYIPYFLFSRKIYSKQASINILTNLLYIFSVFIPASLIIIFGTKINNGLTFDILENRGVTIISYGILNYDLNVQKFLMQHFITYLTYFLIFAYTYSLLFSIIKNFKLDLINRIFIKCIVFSLPLFLVGIDWGRWLNIHFILILLLFTPKLPNQYNFNDNIIKLKDINSLSLLYFTLNIIIATKHYLNGYVLDGIFIRLLKSINFLQFIFFIYYLQFII